LDDGWPLGRLDGSDEGLDDGWPEGWPLGVAAVPAVKTCWISRSVRAVLYT
jgi:hypothetical protein